MGLKDIESRIRERAYLIWESEGGHEGRENEHWARAAHEVLTAAPIYQPVEAAAAAAAASAKKPRAKSAGAKGRLKKAA